MTWLQTASGRAFDLLNPDWRDVDFDEMAGALARLARFTGHVASGPYSVAQHCVIGADAILAETGDAEAAAAFLLHDAHEAYLGDIATPIAQALAQEAAIQADEDHAAVIVRRAISGLKHSVDMAIFRAAGLGDTGMPERHALRTHAYDLRMLKTERQHLLGPAPMRWHESIEQAEPIRLTGKLTVWTWPKAAEAFRDRLERWCPGRHIAGPPRRPAPAAPRRQPLEA